jgi:hypothetical protein
MHNAIARVPFGLGDERVALNPSPDLCSPIARAKVVNLRQRKSKQHYEADNPGSQTKRNGQRSPVGFDTSAHHRN